MITSDGHHAVSITCILLPGKLRLAAVICKLRRNNVKCTFVTKRTSVTKCTSGIKLTSRIKRISGSSRTSGIKRISVTSGIKGIKPKKYKYP